MLCVFLLYLFYPKRFILFKLGNRCVALLLCNFYPFSSGSKHLIFKLQGSCLLLRLNFTCLVFSLVYWGALNGTWRLILNQLWSRRGLLIIWIFAVQLLNRMAVHIYCALVICKVAHGIAASVSHSDLSEGQLPQAFEQLKGFYLI